MRFLFPEALFRIKTNEKVLCLTFDDGPHPGSTPHLLNTLDRCGIKALFFCNGNAAEKYPELIKQITLKGHLIGNHGYSHLNGWKTDTLRYSEDVKRAAGMTSAKIFRPPYGRLTMKQDKILTKQYRLVFWDLMPYDFEPHFGADGSLKILKKKIRSGSIIVLHDTPESTALSFLNEFIDFASARGFIFVVPGF